ncbi:MAG TPA: glycosyltransferase family 9 protein [Gemmatimonadaceae bacterium]
MRLKRLELWWRGLWIKILVRLMRHADDAQPSWDARPHRVLFLRHDRAGDMILSTGVLAAIGKSRPTITMDVLASPANAAILDGSGYVNDVVVFDKKKISSYLPTLMRLRRMHYDAVIDCMVTAPSVTTLLLILASGARYRVGIAGRGNDSAFNITVPPTDRPNAHMVELLAPLAAPFGVGADALRGPTLTLTQDERSRAEQSWGEITGPRALINISAGSSERAWPDVNYAKVMRHLRAREAGVTLRVVSAPSESARGEAIAHEGGGEYVRTPAIRDVFALVASADFVFTPDTSIAHAASAFHTAAVVMFVRGKRERWRLYETSGENVEHSEGTLETLPYATVIAAVDRVWDEVAVALE